MSPKMKPPQGITNKCLPLQEQKQTRQDEEEDLTFEPARKDSSKQKLKESDVSVSRKRTAVTKNTVETNPSSLLFKEKIAEELGKFWKEIACARACELVLERYSILEQRKYIVSNFMKEIRSEKEWQQQQLNKFSKYRYITAILHCYFDLYEYYCSTGNLKHKLIITKYLNFIDEADEEIIEEIWNGIPSFTDVCSLSNNFQSLVYSASASNEHLSQLVAILVEEPLKDGASCSPDLAVLKYFFAMFEGELVEPSTMNAKKMVSPDAFILSAFVFGKFLCDQTQDVRKFEQMIDCIPSDLTVDLKGQRETYYSQMLKGDYLQLRQYSEEYQSTNVMTSSLAKSQFKASFKDPRESLNDCLEEIETIATTWQNTKFMSPCVTFISPSMTGKSRHIAEIGNFHFTFYLCLRKPGESGYPRRTEVMCGELLKEEENSLNVFLRYISMIVASLKYLNGILIELSANSFATTTTSTKAAKKKTVLQVMKRFIEAQTVGTPEENKGIWKTIKESSDEMIISKKSDVKSELKKIKTELRTDLFAKLEACLDLIGNPHAKKIIIAAHKEAKIYTELMNSFGFESLQDLVLVFACDEAGSLAQNETSSGKSHLHYLRMAAALFYDYKVLPFCLILTDTSSTIYHLAPAEKDILDVSFRLSTSKELYPPYYRFNVFNAIYIKDKCLNGHMNTFQTIHAFLLDNNKKEFSEECQKLWKIQAKLGRPAWYGTYIQNNAEAFIELGKVKMIGGKLSESLKEDASELEAIANISCKYLLYTLSCHKVTSRLVAGYMASVDSISSKRDTLYASYQSDVNLAEGSSHVIEDKGLVQMLEKLKMIINKGLVDPGFRGEFLMRIITIHSRDKYCLENEPNSENDLKFSKPILVKDFLGRLLNGDVEKTMFGGQRPGKDFAKLMNGLVFFNHACLLDYYLSEMRDEEDLKLFFTRGIFAQCKERQIGIDGLIPVLLEDGIFTFIGIQARNYTAADPNLKTASSKVTATRIGFENWERPYLILYYAYGSEDCKLENLKQYLPEYKDWVDQLTKAEMEKLKTDESRSEEYDRIQRFQFIVAAHSLDSFRILSEDEKLKKAIEEIRKATADPSVVIPDVDREKHRKYLLGQYEPRYKELK